MLDILVSFLNSIRYDLSFQLSGSIVLILTTITRKEQDIIDLLMVKIPDTQMNLPDGAKRILYETYLQRIGFLLLFFGYLMPIFDVIQGGTSPVSSSLAMVFFIVIAVYISKLLTACSLKKLEDFYKKNQPQQNAVYLDLSE